MTVDRMRRGLRSIVAVASRARSQSRKALSLPPVRGRHCSASRRAMNNVMAQQSEFFAARLFKTLTIEPRSRRVGRGKQLRLLIPIHLAYEIHGRRHG